MRSLSLFALLVSSLSWAQGYVDIPVGGTVGGSGVTGTTGATGATGAGASGASGVSGKTGSTGASGATGSSGVSGSTGATGASGSDGAAGAAGSTGKTGATGSTGATGATGATGGSGATGASGSPAVNPSSQTVVFDDLCSYTNQLILKVSTNISTYSATDDGTLTPDGTHPCIWKIGLAGSTDYFTFMHNASSLDQMTTGGGVLTVEGLVSIRNLSDGTDTYTVKVGAGDSTSGTPVDGLFFLYTHSNNSGKWSCVASNNSTTTTVDSSVTVSINTWYGLRITTDGSTADCFVSTSGGAWTNIGTISSNIPNLYTRLFTAPWAQFAKSAGSGTKSVVIDYLYMQKLLTR